MPAAPATTIAEIKTIPFLAKRLEAVVAAILRHPQETVLWVGAGLSAKYAAIPTWAAFLRERLAEVTPVGGRDHQLIEQLIASGRFTIAAECLEQQLGERLRQAMIQTFGSPRGGLPEKLAYFCVRDVVCTNYDTLLEQVLPFYRVVFPSEGIEALLADDEKIVKIHGSITEPKSCVLSLSSYVRAYNVNLKWYLTNVFATSTVVFLGCSMNQAEPFFHTLSLLRRAGRKVRPHYAVVAMADEATVKLEGKRLQEFGIELIPYIPDANHSFIDGLIEHIDDHRGDREMVEERIRFIRGQLARGRRRHALLPLWHLAHAPITAAAERRALGDLLNDFFSTVLQPADTARAFLAECATAKLDIADLWRRYTEIVVPTRKTVQGLERTLGLIAAATGRDYPYLKLTVAELKRKAAAHREGDDPAG